MHKQLNCVDILPYRMRNFAIFFPVTRYHGTGAGEESSALLEQPGQTTTSALLVPVSDALLLEFIRQAARDDEKRRRQSPGDNLAPRATVTTSPTLAPHPPDGAAAAGNDVALATGSLSMQGNTAAAGPGVHSADAACGSAVAEEGRGEGHDHHASPTDDLRGAEVVDRGSAITSV